MTTAFFDIETRRLFSEAGGEINRLQLAVAALIVDDEPVRFFEEEDVAGLFEALKEADQIVGHNVVRFDYAVLDPYAAFNVCREFLPKTVDTLLEIKKKTGALVSLDNLALNNLGRGKTDSAKRMPILWRLGYCDKVKEYCAADVELVRDIYRKGKTERKLTYTHKENGVEIGIREVAIDW